jgi:hypothetical protein
MLTCEHCGREFPANPSRPTKRYCRSDCRRLERHKRYRIANREMIAEKRRRARLLESDCSQFPVRVADDRLEPEGRYSALP